MRSAILSVFFTDPGRAWYLSDLAKHLGLTPSTLQRDLASLSKASILRSTRSGNRVYYQADTECPFFSELRGLILKTAGIVDVLREHLSSLEKKIRVAFVYGSVARAEEKSGSDIDLLVVGSVRPSDLAMPLRKAEARLQRPINPTVFSEAEFKKKVSAGHHFLKAVLSKEKIFVFGALDGLEGASRSRSS